METETFKKIEIPKGEDVETSIENRYSNLILEDILGLKAEESQFIRNGILGEKRKMILEDLQANILKGTKHKYTLFCFLKFYDEDNKMEIIEWLKHIPMTSALDQANDEKADAISLLLSYEGYTFFFDPDKIKQNISSEDDDIIAFIEGLAKRCPKAFGNKKRSMLEKNYKDPAHALILIASNDDCLKDWNSLEDNAEKNSKLLDFFKRKTEIKNQKPFERWFGRLFFEIGMRNPQGSDGDIQEWFGFKDGISNPRFFPSNGLKEKLGFEPDEPSKLNVVLRPNKLAPKPYACGSFVVFLKLEQDIDAFKYKVHELAKKLNMERDEGLVEAYLMGRRKGGIPLHKDFRFPPNGNHNLNSFDFKDDPEGKVCPFHSHIRKANPRDGHKKRIVRRGTVYGHEKSKEKGLLFLSYQSSLRTFEEIINNGLYSYNYKNRNVGQDPLFAEKGKYAKSHLYRDASGMPVYNTYVNTSNELVRFKGGQYFFASSISFIRFNLENFI